VTPRADRPRRRVFTAEYKQKILAEYDAAQASGAKGALLRREGLYSSHLVEWRRASQAGTLTGPDAKPGRRTAQQVENDRLRARAERAETELAKTRAALDVVGKAHALLELLSESAEVATPSSRSSPRR
jgi:transposase-like protein